MALGPRLDLRQTQSLVMTPQLQQAIKLLTLSNLEIEAFIGDALDANPLLEMGEALPVEPVEIEARRTSLESSPCDQLIGEGMAAEDRPLDISAETLDVDRDTGDGGGDTPERYEPAFEGEATISGGGEAPAMEEYGAFDETLAEHLHGQIGAVVRDPKLAFIARFLIDQLDDAGYLAASLREIAMDLQVSPAEVEAALALVQSLDPTGVGARSLSECIALQAREADRYDPAMARLIDNLEMIARGELPRLRRMCGVDEEDFADMLAELRGYDPKPGLRYGGGAAAPVVPDILITARADGGWNVALNQATLPKLILNRSYYLEMRGACAGKTAGKEDRGWLSEKLADANWLVKALDQRQKTILKVASELVRQQEGFFRRGVSQLKPLTLRAVAETVGLHESTVSRVTSNKYLMCERGTFELKYFFTSGVSGADGEGVSAEAVKAAIKQLIDNEDPKKILSDDTLVDLLKAKGFELARRTVAKYREAIGLGSSVQRRRQKALSGKR
ncbi:MULTISPECIES: RNA polymerase factor sigma-54 [unclassified Novosphingobium]|uniref:RNA polymerase factor sigma-54 n=1 Tax=unclassified Novosphingobium TaxID=2644732 RepID=UPI00086B824F|nr:MULTISPECIES: RNA polymerase factor sigma-54 [unclassified Novosphingobium]MBN9145946.1 RNA polymerase factor sigma-54 [Novosphingobium sp.]MDR6709959.1 RNA polymerase sigma-54 factor [Novosphingobium sp. 1748]ODU80476.1 MAG: RNA polymerase sigma-54 factor [Novosphingobium sp. SCN 63-17]OJX95838.1 MAG: RNA polymerase sigma-54 factor [Novosphingobium sp. 63-713]